MTMKWEKPELEIIGFESEDVITTSNGMTNGGGNGDGGYKSGPGEFGGFGDLQ